jgi:hypothetical protein
VFRLPTLPSATARRDANFLVRGFYYCSLTTPLVTVGGAPARAVAFTEWGKGWGTPRRHGARASDGCGLRVLRPGRAMAEADWLVLPVSVHVRGNLVAVVQRASYGLRRRAGDERVLFCLHRTHMRAAAAGRGRGRSKC